MLCLIRCTLQEQISNQHKEIDEAETAADVARELVEAEEQKLQAAEQQLQGAHARQQRANQAVTEPLTGSLPMVSGHVFPIPPKSVLEPGSSVPTRLWQPHWPPVNGKWTCLATKSYMTGSSVPVRL